MMVPMPAPCLECESRLSNIFCGLPPDLLEIVNKKKITRHYSKKQNLYFEEQPAPGVYCIKSGRVKIFKTGPDGKEYILHIADPGEVVGIEAIFGGEAYFASAEVLEEATICFVDKEVIFEIVRREPSTAERIIRVLANELQESQEDRLELARFAVRERMARLLAILSKSHGSPTPEGVLIDLKLSREELADMVGTATETAMRLLKDFKEEKLVAVKGRDITVLDGEGLSRTGHMFE